MVPQRSRLWTALHKIAAELYVKQTVKGLPSVAGELKETKGKEKF